MKTIFSQLATFFTPENALDAMIVAWNEQEVKDAIIGTVQKRLKEKGRDNKNLKLKTDNSNKGVYSPRNPKNKKQGLVDLYVTGDFYDSFRIIAKKAFFEMSAEFEKQDGNIFDNFRKIYDNEKTFENRILLPTKAEIYDLIEPVLLPFFIKEYMRIFKSYT